MLQNGQPGLVHLAQHPDSHNPSLFGKIPKQETKAGPAPAQQLGFRGRLPLNTEVHSSH